MPQSRSSEEKLRRATGNSWISLDWIVYIKEQRRGAFCDFVPWVTKHLPSLDFKMKSFGLNMEQQKESVLERDWRLEGYKPTFMYSTLYNITVKHLYIIRPRVFWTPLNTWLGLIPWYLILRGLKHSWNWSL